MNFLADVNISRHMVERPRLQGHSVVRVPDVMDPRSSDQAIIVEARRRGAVVISFGQDFGAILAIMWATSPSLVNLPGSSWIVRMSYPVESRRVAKEWRGVWHGTHFRNP